MYYYYYYYSETGITQSIYQLATGSMADEPESESRQCQGFSLLYSVKTASVAHPATYPMDIGIYFPWGESAGT
jgi:hypothetical protein